MAEDAENHTLKLLQEMRKEIGDSRAEMRERFDDVDMRIDGLSHIVTLLAANMGGHDQRIEDLEAAVEGLKTD